MTDWRILVVDDDIEICEQIKDYIDGEVVGNPSAGCLVEFETDFNKALNLLEIHRIDLVILDVRGSSIETIAKQGETEAESGIDILEQIKRRRFVPVIFYTGLPQKVEYLSVPLVRVISKTDGVKSLLKEIKEIFNTGIPNLNRALIRHIEEQQRIYMWGFVSDNYETFGNADDKASLAYMLARRLAVSLSSSGIENFIGELGASTSTGVSTDKVHPMQYYVLPPLEKPEALAADIYKKLDTEEYYILLTPSCDLEQGKADWLLMARCLPLTEMEEYNDWLEANTDSKKEDKLRSLLRNNRSLKGKQPKRFFFLPAALTLPDLVVDFQQLSSIKCDALNAKTQKYNRIASLDSPYAESLMAQFSQFFGRLGTPDLDVDNVITRLSQKLPFQSE